MLFTEGGVTGYRKDFPSVMIGDGVCRRRSDAMRQRLGDAAKGIAGSEIRKEGRVPFSEPLTEFNPSHPYMIAAYDLPDMPTMIG